ncbi:MAG: hypothetical protein AAB565_00375 [Patescibacteria group bacterium]
MVKISRNFKNLLIILVLSLPFWLGVNYFEKRLENFFFWYQISNNPQVISQIFTAQLDQKLEDLKPLRNRKTGELNPKVKSAISILIDKKGKERILLEKESNLKLPIASLTKLMTAWVVLEHYDFSKEITVSKKASLQYGENGKLKEGKTFKVEYFLYPLLMESSNGAAISLSNDYEGIKERDFIVLMNEEAQKLGLNSTFFANPTGLDPEESKTEMNYSTTVDLVKLTKELLKKPLIWEILALPKYSLYGPELINTNKLLIDGGVGWQGKIIGGKTGFTDQAGGILLLVLRAPRGQGTLINVVLGAEGVDQRFQEMRKLLDWLKEAYYW